MVEYGIYFDGSFYEIRSEYVQNDVKYHFYSILMIVNELLSIWHVSLFLHNKCAMEFCVYSGVCKYCTEFPVSTYVFLLEIDLQLVKYHLKMKNMVSINFS